jgi:hypothetical protein
MNEQSLADLVLEADPDLPERLLGRLASLLARQMAAASPAERNEVSLATIATFLECVALGLSDQACDMIEQVSGGLGASAQLVA